MTLELSDAQRLAIQRGEPVQLLVDELGELIIVKVACLQDEEEKSAWAQLARRAAQSWGQENAFE